MDNQHKVAMGFTGGDAGVLRIKGMGFFDHDIVTFYGSDPKAFAKNLNHRFRETQCYTQSLHAFRMSAS